MAALCLRATRHPRHHHSLSGQLLFGHGAAAFSYALFVMPTVQLVYSQHELHGHTLHSTLQDCCHLMPEVFLNVMLQCELTGLRWTLRATFLGVQLLKFWHSPKNVLLRIRARLHLAAPCSLLHPAHIYTHTLQLLGTN